VGKLNEIDGKASDSAKLKSKPREKSKLRPRSNEIEGSENEIDGSAIEKDNEGSVIPRSKLRSRPRSNEIDGSANPSDRLRLGRAKSQRLTG
jgi:hypothetical protein